MPLLRPIPALVLATVAAATAAGAQGSIAASTIDRAARLFAKSGTVQATFEQTLNNPLTGNQSKSSGELALAHPGKFSLRFSQGGDRVVADGKWLWVYLPGAAPGQVLKLPASSKSTVGLDVVGDLLTAPRSKFDVTDGGAATIDGRATRAVILTPKQEGQGITKAQVWVDDATSAVRQIVLTQETGLERTWRITSWVPDAKIPRATFSFKVPSGVRVVDQSAFGAP